MDITTIDLIVYNTLSFCIGLSIGLILMVIQRRWEKTDKKGEYIEKQLLNKLKNHKMDLINKVLKKLYQSQIKRDEFGIWKDNFNVWIENLDELKKKKVYTQAIEHLKAYPDIGNIWIDSNNNVEKLNIELKNLREYIANEIVNKLEKDYVRKLRSPIWYVMEKVISQTTIKEKKDVNEFLDDIKLGPEDNPVSIDYKEKNLITFFCGGFNVIEIKKFILDLIHSDAVFREEVAKITIGYKKLKKAFDDNFKNELDGLLQDLKGREEELKGECYICSSWVKEIG